MAAALRRRPLRVLRLAALLFPLLSFLSGRTGRGELKAAVVRAVLGGWRREQVEALTTAYVAARVPGLAFPEALEALRRHRAAGDRLVLLSASPDLYVPALARALGFDEALCTGITWRDGCVEGHLATPNRRGEEKLRCLEALKGRHPGLTVAAYGNAASDLPHLLACERGFYINPSPRDRQRLAASGLTLLDWR